MKHRKLLHKLSEENNVTPVQISLARSLFNLRMETLPKKRLIIVFER